jgi:hypothetical protein
LLPANGSAPRANTVNRSNITVPRSRGSQAAMAIRRYDGRRE